MSEGIRILHVDDEPDLAELASTFLEREDERFTVVTATSASQGREMLDKQQFECIISDYEMPGQSGIEFLETVREEHSDLPFILYTGKGSEEVASDALSAGATDYLQKEVGTEQYEILANRVLNAVEQYRAQQRATELERIRRLVHDVNQALVRANSRSELETRVCEIISDSDPYRFAWIGEVDPETDRVVPRAWGGLEDGYLDQVTLTTDETATGQGPTGTAIRERRVAVSQHVLEDPNFTYQEAALERG
jgi:CheY-like chemotaxis protein